MRWMVFYSSFKRYVSCWIWILKRNINSLLFFLVAFFFIHLIVFNISTHCRSKYRLEIDHIDCSWQEWEEWSTEKRQNTIKTSYWVINDVILFISIIYQHKKFIINFQFYFFILFYFNACCCCRCCILRPDNVTKEKESTWNAFHS